MKRFYNNKVLTTYLILQPIIDIITGLMKAYFSVSLSLAMIIRFLFIIYCAIYIIKYRDKKIITYIIIWLSYILISTIGNYFIKDNFNILAHFYSLFRVIYFSVVLLFFYIYMKKHKEIDNKVFTYMSLLVGISLIISLITKTSFCSYDDFANCEVKGFVGYFFSANEYGSILIALLGYQLISFLTKKKIINFISLSLIVFFLCVLGTKTGMMGLIGLFLVYIIYYFISLIFKREKKYNLLYVGVISIMLLTVLLFIKKMPIYYNLVTQFEEVVEVVKTEQPEVTTTVLQKEVASSLVFNGRTDFVNINKQIYNNSPIFNKIFGLTTQGNYFDNVLVTHINERDFHDLYMFYGIIGLIIELLLPLSLAYSLIKKLIKNIKILLNDEIAIMGMSLILLLMVSYMAGHSLTHPGVSFYIAYIINDLLKKVGKCNE